MNKDQLLEFMRRHQLSNKQFASLLGVTEMAVLNWLGEKRSVSLTVVRLLKLFDKHPNLMSEFLAA